MGIFISHFSAAAYWKIPGFNDILPVDKKEPGLVHCTVTTRAKKYVRKGYKTHICQMKLPEGGIVKVGDALVASPELVFLQLATEISLHRLILLGLQLCSFTPGNSNNSITTKKKLQRFIDRTPRFPGRQNSMRALKYIKDGSSSLMESLVYMILNLPHTLGGYGLDGSVFNYKVQLGKEAAQLLNQQHCYIDIFYKQNKVAVEYDSFLYHNSPKAQGKDAIRSEILQRMGFKMMHLKTIQLYNPMACDDFANNLGKHLGKRIRIRARKYEMMRNQLRSLLPLMV